MQSLFRNKKILIGIVVIIVAFFVYGIIFVGGNKTSTSDVTRQAAPSSSTDSSSLDVTDGPGKEFVSQLLTIQGINFKLSLFRDPVFQNLIVTNTELVPQQQGRDNPFLPLDIFGQRTDLSSQASSLNISSGSATSSKVVPKGTIKTKKTR